MRKLPNRKLNRLKDYDYSQEGYYFVTTCTKNHEHFFGKIENDKIILNKYGEIVERQWLWLENQYNYINLDVYIIMPNHFHGILIISHSRDRSRPVPTMGKPVPTMGKPVPTTMGKPVPTMGKPVPAMGKPVPAKKIKTLSELIGAFKTTSSKLIHQNGLINFAWQRSFYDHIILDPKSLFNIRKYIKNNPPKWALEQTRKHLSNIEL